MVTLLSAANADTLQHMFQKRYHLNTCTTGYTIDHTSLDRTWQKFQAFCITSLVTGATNGSEHSTMELWPN